MHVFVLFRQLSWSIQNRLVGALRCAVQVVLYMADTYEIQVANITVI